METRSLGKIAENISLLGFGCMRFPLTPGRKQEIDETAAQELIDYAFAHGVNYFDTAYPYHGGKSELFIGKALEKYPRGQFYLADKMPLWSLRSAADAARIFDEQLKKCRVTYFDFYLLHNINERTIRTDEKYQVYEFLKQKKAEGKIRHLGFSFHDTPEVLERYLDAHEWDFVQLQINYLDWEMQDAKRQYQLAADRGIPVIVMEPVRGGSLVSLCDKSVTLLNRERPQDSTASWAIRYAASLPGVLTVLSGMSALGQVADNVRTMTDFVPLSEREREVLGDALGAYRASGAIPCTGCRYCMECPAGVDIPRVFAMYNQYCVEQKKGFHPFSNTFSLGKFALFYHQMGKEKQAASCVSCKKCMSHCPQKIDIPAALALVDKRVRFLNKVFGLVMR